MLPYANQMFLDILHEDGLVVAAKGLGVEEVFFNLLKVYSDPGNLVLVIGANEEEEEYFLSRLKQEQVKAVPKKITTEYSAAERQRLYLEGGVLFITTRILVVEMLTERIPFDLITGILIYKAHRTISNHQESFILRLYRDKNKKGFIKAFSGSPTSFTSGFCQVSRVMRTLFVRNLYLWPRFHANVVESLKDKTTPEVIELHIDMTQAMKNIQTAILDSMNFTLQELKQRNPSLSFNDSDEEYLSVENAMSKTFHKTLQRELDPIWHQLSGQTKRLVSDMKTLRSILSHLTHYDCITFYSFLSAIKTTENAIKSGGWMVMDAAETLFASAKSRVFPSENKFEFEEVPKWKILKEIIDEIKQENKDDSITLVLAADERQRVQLLECLDQGSQVLLQRLYNKCLGEKYGLLPDVKEIKDKGKGKKSSSTNNAVVEEPLNESDSIVLESFQIGHFAINKLINELNPKYFVLYDCDISIVRQIEVYQASHPEKQVKVYFMVYGKSVEEQAYLSSLRQEKEAFEKLIKEKATMVIPEDREGRNNTNPDLIRDDGEKESSLNNVTRKGGGLSQDKKPTPKIIVDMREFNSELPGVLHKKGIDIEPITLEVGDYILTPEICVERKSISDLIGSLNCGRLYNQATSMTRFYARPMLLIEFDQNKPFALQGKYYLSRDVGSSDLVQRLQLLTIHFPKLRILWSPGPHATADLFAELKRGREEPDAAKAASISMDIIDDYNSEKFNPAIKDFILKLPGITTRNVFGILNRVNSLLELMSLKVEDLEELLGSKENAKDVYQALHEKLLPSDTDPKNSVIFHKKGKSGKPDGSRFKSKRN